MPPGAAAKRAGAEEALRRVLDFLALNVSKMDDEQRAEWRTYLHGLTLAPASYTVASDTPADTRDLLTGVHAKAEQGIRSLLMGGGMPMPPALLVGIPTQDHPVRHDYEFHWEPANQRDAMVAGIADLVRRVGQTLRTCQRPGCTRLFLGKKRATFCSLDCQQREMNRRKAASRKAARAAKRQGETNNG